MEKNSRVQRWFGTAGPQGDGDACGVMPAAPDLVAIRAAMREAVIPCSPLHRLRAEGQISRAGTAMELWLLRADLFQYLGQDVGQLEAARRIAGMLPLFGSAVPAVAAPSKTPDNRGHAAHAD